VCNEHPELGSTERQVREHQHGLVQSLILFRSASYDLHSKLVFELAKL